ncbi:hypothetical protein M2651_00680 [Clostridium sp. SYSU_GA19001]|uniref:hypothetical protein n=1 Tax=Clostridium caldaquaticum TaxID=2940653 RepID=UPI0020776759|nr:hypothetical protein [Clostridium caldaquaticum]MCM8709536.1 hypothetical protein [Clostridium caldaquaticum]
MDPILYVKTDIRKAYNDESFFGKIRDRFKIREIRESVIKDLNLSIAHIKIPPNLNLQAYRNNMETVKRFMKKRNPCLAPKTYRYYDYKLLNDFQKKLFAYGIVESIKLILRIKNKSIKSSCILVYDGADDINREVIFQLSKECKYFILLSHNVSKISELRDYVVANYGISPIVTSDYNYALSKADFIISSRELQAENLVWYIDNSFMPKENSSLAINDISFSVPWDSEELEFGFELLGAILNQMQERDIDTALKYNGIYLDKIKFNDEVKQF